MKQNLCILCLASIAFYWVISAAADGTSSIKPIDKNTSLEEARIALGAAPLIHHMDAFDAELAVVGEQLIIQGKANYKEFKGKRISSYFVCTDCHNLGLETLELTSVSQQDRLDYAVQNKIPFLPGSTLFGVYNRTSFYNDDYYKKYGNLVFGARDSLRNAIQLCAEYCASGRTLLDWELEAMMHYFKREELTLKDLQLTTDEMDLVSTASNKTAKIKDAALSVLNDHYVTAYRAHFPGAMNENKRTYGATGNALNGKKIYESSCMFCHGNARVTYLNLENDVLSGSFLWNNKEGYGDKSIYQVIRWGTYPIAGRKQYMPLYTTEKLTDGQIEDLLAYIKQLANK